MHSNTIAEFIEKIDDIYAVNIDLNLAFPVFSDKLNRLLKNANGNQKLLYGSGHPNDPKSKVHLSISIKDFKERIKPQGKDSRILTNLCLVSIYQLWEDEYRARIAIDLGVEKKDIKSDIFGEIRIIRQAIIHNNGKKTSDFEKFKIINHLQEKPDILFSKDEFHQLIARIKDDILKLIKH